MPSTRKQSHTPVFHRKLILVKSLVNSQVEYNHSKRPSDKTQRQLSGEALWPQRDGDENPPFSSFSSAVMPGDGDVHIPFHQKLVVGALAGVFGTSVIFPIDTVKTRLQNQVKDPISGNRMYKGPWNCLTTIFRKEGFR